MPANPLYPCLQHSNPLGKTWVHLVCLKSPVSRWYGIEGSTLARHFTLDHTPMAQSMLWQDFWSVGCTSSFPQEAPPERSVGQAWLHACCHAAPALHWGANISSLLVWDAVWSTSCSQHSRRDLHDTRVPKHQMPHVWGLTHTLCWAFMTQHPMVALALKHFLTEFIVPFQNLSDLATLSVNGALLLFSSISHRFIGPVFTFSSGPLFLL